ncbi:MAG TPA: hypothetical protein P5571_05585 [Candidatus Krumholzibacteria bacterium]|nr:hypothetical protein [Candidatus Krumholzibacteria bacterium]HRX50810.1 hypothetical protein [Candidatus Krumholzibacteria bacterium]
MRTTLIAAVLATLVVGLVPRDAEAIPAFARRWKVSCTTCHAPFPRLKEFGEEFAGNGFTIPEDDKDRDYVAAGDDLLKLNKDFPVAGRFDAFAVWDDGKTTEYDLQSPWGLKLLSGGPLAPKTGYYFYFYMSERGEVAGVEDAILHFDDVFSSGLDVIVGQFQTSDPLMKRELRLTFEDYLLYKMKPGASHTDLTYDRGLMLTYGVESSGTDLVMTVTNGNGKGEADEQRQFDDNNRKNVGLRLTQALGDRAGVGFYSYLGREDLEDGGEMLDNGISIWGPDVSLDLGKVALTAQYLVRTDDAPLAGMADVESKGAIAELIYAPGGDLGTHWFTLLYNKVDSDLDALDYETITGGVTYTLARNVRLMAEFTRDLERETNRAVLGTVTAF